MSYFSQGEASYYVYAVLCQDGEGPLYVKFGYSGDIYRRLREINQGSPIPARYFAIIEVSNRNDALDLEKGLHKVFDGRKSRGEWFRFDSKAEEDKAEFNEGCRWCFSQYRTVADQRSWTKVSVKALDKYFENKKKLLSKYNFFEKRGKEEKEYAKYRDGV